jgi:hypothetical protein
MLNNQITSTGGIYWTKPLLQNKFALLVGEAA